MIEIWDTLLLCMVSSKDYFATYFRKNIVIHRIVQNFFNYAWDNDKKKFKFLYSAVIEICKILITIVKFQKNIRVEVPCQ